MQNSDIKNTLLSNKQISIMESIYHNSTEKYAFTTFTSVLDIILISIKKKKKLK